MSRAIGRIGAVVAALVVIAVVLVAALAAGALGIPSVTGIDNRFGDVNETTTVIETDVAVRNPNPVGLRLGSLGIDYTVRLNEVALATGAKRGLSVPPGRSTVAFTTAMANERISAWWVSHIRNNEHTAMQVEATVTAGLLNRTVAVTPVERSIETDILSAFNSTETRTVDANSLLVSDPLLYINETRAAWGDVSTSTTPLDMTVVVYNPKPVPYTVTKVSYTVSMNDVTVGEGETARDYVIQPGVERTIEATTAIRNDRLDEWWVSHLERDQVTEMRIEFEATVALPGGQTVALPLDALTYTETIETDFFGDEGASDEGVAG